MILRATARLETPTAISQRRATGNDLDTLAFVPGTTLRGALAETCLRQGSAEDRTFATLFLEDQVRFGDLRLGGNARWPLSARWCRENPEHPLMDLLFLYGARELTPAGNKPDLEALLECQATAGRGGTCKAKMGYPGEGYYFLNSNQRYEAGNPDTRRVAHVEIDPGVLRSRNGRFHSASVLTRHQTFEGKIWASPEGAETLKKITGKGLPLWIGRGRSRGQGRITLWVDDDQGISTDEMEQQINTFNQAAVRAFSCFAGQVLFSCTLDSAAILFDEFLLSKDSVSAADIDPELEGYKLLTCFTRPVDIVGWNAGPRAQLPKPEVRAIAAGSCFLFAHEQTSDRKQQVRRVAEILTRVHHDHVDLHTCHINRNFDHQTILDSKGDVMH